MFRSYWQKHYFLHLLTNESQCFVTYVKKKNSKNDDASKRSVGLHRLDFGRSEEEEECCSCRLRQHLVEYWSHHPDQSLGVMAWKVISNAISHRDGGRALKSFMEGVDRGMRKRASSISVSQSTRNKRRNNLINQQFFWPRVFQSCVDFAMQWKKGLNVLR